MRKAVFCLLIFTLFFISCSTPLDSNGLSMVGFYNKPEKIISIIDGKASSAGEYFLLATACKRDKKYKKALLYFANSCFESKRVKKLRPYPSPVYNFISSFSFKSEYYDDALYEIAEIFYYYNEFKYVVKFVDKISDKDISLLYNGGLLKARALSRLKKYDRALETLSDLRKDIKQESFHPIIYIRMASIYEKQGEVKEAIENYMKTLEITSDSWHGAIAAKKVYELAGNTLSGDEKNIVAEALYKAREYEKAYSLAKGNEELRLKSLVRLKKYNDADKIIDSYKSKKIKYGYLKALKADVLWFAGKKNRSIKIYREIFKIEKLDNRERYKRLLRYYRNRGKLSLMERNINEFLAKYPDDEKNEYYYWFKAKQRIRKKRYNDALPYLKKILKKFPEGSYSSNARFWCWKIYIKRKEKTRAFKYLKELFLYNPGSSYAWGALKNNVQNFSETKLLKAFEEAVKNEKLNDALISNYILFARSGDMERAAQRASSLKQIGYDKYDQFNSLIRGNSDREIDPLLKNLEKYFKIGYASGIKRTLKFLEENDENKIDKYMTLSRLGDEYGQYYYALMGTLGLMKSLDLDENLSLMSPEAIKRLLPLAFDEQTSKMAKKYNVDKYKMFSIMRAETSFNASAVSPVGAVGLVQLMPATAEDLAKRMKLKEYDLKDPFTSIIFGTYYVNWIHKYYTRNFMEVVAGYNAGMGNVRKWKKRFKKIDDDLLIESVPPAETRYYMLRNRKFYYQYSVIYKNYKK